ncbi:hypothetical protein CALCODRAFT_313750 [Calocera cornea HHB12733]|uniref:Uncharacterized protein n=1 Tax=Calocera cornea HHB12733 TaxID=1353952 RepID=A0A165FEB0_9BASI|nr:hypothetical protein CALCODRAFT_313750 [Calocera cornea HHB12733]
MERALQILEIVELIVGHVAGDPTENGVPRRVDDKSPRLGQLEKLARVARAWWRPAVKGLYHDVNAFHVHRLLAILHPDWKCDKTPDDMPTYMQWNRFLAYTRYVRLITAYIQNGPYNQDPSFLCNAVVFETLAVLQARYSPTRSIFPNLEILNLSVNDESALCSTVVLFQPKLRWFACNFIEGTPRGIPKLLEAMAHRASEIRHVSLAIIKSQAVSSSDVKQIGLALPRLLQLKEFMLSKESLCS